MNITEHENKILKIDHIPMNCDHILSEHFVEPLDSFLSGFCCAILGPRGSGKTNYLCSLLNKGKKKGNQLGFRNIFHNIFIVSPSLKSIKNSPFDDLDENWIHDELTVETLERFEELCREAAENAEENDKPAPFNLLILDDCGTKIRKNKPIENKFNQLVSNIRHQYNCSLIMLLQYSNHIPPSVRSNLTHVISFLPKTLKEKENIFMTWSGLKRKNMEDFFEFVFKKPHDTLFIDLTNRTGNYKFYRNFNLLEFK